MYGKNFQGNIYIHVVFCALMKMLIFYFYIIDTTDCHLDLHGISVSQEITWLV